MIDDIEERDAIILFADMMNSVSISNALKVQDYGSLIQKYQDCLDKTASNMGFKDNGIDMTCSATGDQFLLFYHPKKTITSEDCLKIIMLAIKLKLSWLVETDNLERLKNDLHPFDIGIGLHFGRVAYLKDKVHENFKIEGYAINYAKRVESFSRYGNYSNLMVSEDFYNKIKDNYLFWEKHKPPIDSMKGISGLQYLYELKDFYKDELGETLIDIDDYQNDIKNIINETDIKRSFYWLYITYAHYLFRKVINARKSIQDSISFSDSMLREKLSYDFVELSIQLRNITLMLGKITNNNYIFYLYIGNIYYQTAVCAKYYEEVLFQNSNYFIKEIVQSIPRPIYITVLLMLAKLSFRKAQELNNQFDLAYVGEYNCNFHIQLMLFDKDPNYYDLNNKKLHYDSDEIQIFKAICSNPNFLLGLKPLIINPVNQGCWHLIEQALKNLPIPKA